MTKLLTQLPFMIALAATAAPGLGQRSAAGTDWQASLLAAREAAWRNYYGDTHKLAAMLPDDFVAMGLGGKWGNKTETLANSRADIAAGTRIVSLKFPENKDLVRFVEFGEKTSGEFANWNTPADLNAT